MIGVQVRNRRVSRTAGALLILVTGCGILWYCIKVNGEDQGMHSPVEMSAWITDWQWREALDDLRPVAAELASVQMFAAYFDANDRLYVTSEFEAALPQLVKAYRGHGGTGEIYLTVVNDRYLPDGTVVQREAALVRRLLATEESRRRHMQELIDAVLRYGFDGVELNYSKSDEETWRQLVLFMDELCGRLKQMDKEFRVVLEPGAPLEGISLPEGPVYVMMAYNLHGTHNGPGPKANPALIKRLAAKLDRIPGHRYLAFALGGFDWSEGRVTALTEKEAVALTARSSVRPERDEESGSLYFIYKDDKQARHEVWYADELTLKLWRQAAREAGYGSVALWRLGGLDAGMLQEIRNADERVSALYGRIR
ncbi:glycosyl hydrolase [Paenibacillus filicis]|uniref:Glycosyl hydrolase n=1 Tax=Paenibacillus filicis TaxID=669464 RepID=A0ABU9DTJ5_9BACL